MEFINTRKAKEQLSHYLNNLEESGPIVITSRGTPRGLLISFPEEELISLAIEHSEKVQQMIQAGLSEIERGKTYSVEDARKLSDKLRKTNAA